MFFFLNFLKPVHVQNVHLLPQYTPSNDFEQSDIPYELLLMEYLRWHVQISIKTGFLYTNLTRTWPQSLLWGSCKNLHDCISTLVISGTSLSSAPTIQHILHRSIDLNLSRVLVIVTLVGSGAPNSILQRLSTSSIFSTFK